MYAGSNKHQFRQRLGSFDADALKAFATHSLSLLEESDTHFTLDGLVRVDLFDNNGQLVVNEFEGLEANCFSTKIVEEGLLIGQLEQYWEDKIYEGIAQLFA